MAKRVRVSPEAKAESDRRGRESNWTLFQRQNFCGHRSCFKCGLILYCVGKTYERQMCRTCFMQYGPT